MARHYFLRCPGEQCRLKTRCYKLLSPSQLSPAHRLAQRDDMGACLIAYLARPFRQTTMILRPASCVARTGPSATLACFTEEAAARTAGLGLPTLALIHRAGISDTGTGGTSSGHPLPSRESSRERSNLGRIRCSLPTWHRGSGFLAGSSSTYRQKVEACSVSSGRDNLYRPPAFVRHEAEDSRGTAIIGTSMNSQSRKYRQHT